jgi:predicted MFS family arabinose efflux permease
VEGKGVLGDNEHAIKRFKAEVGIAAMIKHLAGNPALKSADFRRLWVASAFNHLGMIGEQVILSLLAFHITQSTAWVGAVLALYFLPMLIFGLLSGAIADRLDRRGLLRGMELVIISNLVLFAVALASVSVGLWIILVFTVISGTARAIYQPARLSYAYDIVGGQHIVAGLGLLNLGIRLGQLAGALLAGAAMQRLGTPAALLVLAAAHVVAFASVLRLRSVGLAAGVERVPIGQNLREYMHEIRVNRNLLMLLIVTASVEIFGYSFMTALPELATTQFGMGAEGLGVMHAALATGGILASLLLVGLGGPRRKGLVYLACIFVFGGSLILLAGSGVFVLALAALLMVAGSAVATNILTQSMFQLSVPDHLRGRAMGVWVLAVGTGPLGHLEMGGLAVSIGLGGALFANGAALIGIGILTAIFAPRLRKL